MFGSAYPDRILGGVKLLQPTTLEPAKHFFIGMLTLIPRRVPVEGVQYSPSRIDIERHRYHVLQQTASGFPHQWNAPQELVYAVERNHSVTQRMQHLVGHTARCSPVNVTHPIPLVIATV